MLNPAGTSEGAWDVTATAQDVVDFLPAGTDVVTVRPTTPEYYRRWCRPSPAARRCRSRPGLDRSPASGQVSPRGIGRTHRMNPLLADWKTPFGLPPFAAIATDDFAPAFDAALAEARANLDAIAADPEPPSFANTIEAMERAQARLDRVAAVFFGLAGAHTSDAIEALQRSLSPRLAAHHAETMMNARALRPRRRARTRDARRSA